MTHSVFQLQDFYTAGIGFDLGGAFLLARGLINPPADLTRLSMSFFDSNRYQAVSVAKNRLDAVAGVCGLFAGFVLQAVGYVAYLSTSHSNHTGGKEALVAAGFALLALVLMLTLGGLYRRFGLVPLLVEMARWTLIDERTEYPSATLLPGWIEALGKARQAGEDDLAFVNRFAHVKNLRVSVASLPGSAEGRSRLWTDDPLEGED